MESGIKRETRSVLVILAAVLAIFLVPFSSHGEEGKEYRVSSASFIIDINEDGSVQVTETWEVEYTKGSFNQWQKEIRDGIIPDEGFTLNEESVKVRVDGEPCEWTDDREGRPDQTYHVDEYMGDYLIECYKTSENVTREYEVSYILRDAVKIVGYGEDGYNYFTYHLIGTDFPDKIGMVYVKVYTPEEEMITELIKDGSVFGQQAGPENGVAISNWTGSLETRVKIKGTRIENAEHILGAGLDREFDPDRTDEEHVRGVDYGEGFPLGKFGYFIFFLILGLLVGLFKKIVRSGAEELAEMTINAMGSGTSEGKAETPGRPQAAEVNLREAKANQNEEDVKRIEAAVRKKLEENPTCYTDLIMRWQDRLSPVEFAYGHPHAVARNLLVGYANYLLLIGAIGKGDDGKAVVVLKKELLPQDRYVLAFLSGEKADSLRDGMLVDMDRFGRGFELMVTKFEERMKNFLEKKVEKKLTAEEQDRFSNDWISLSEYVDYLDGKSGNETVDYCKDASRNHVQVFLSMKDPANGYNYVVDGEDESARFRRNVNYAIHRALQSHYRDAE